MNVHGCQLPTLCDQNWGFYFEYVPFRPSEKNRYAPILHSACSTYTPWAMISEQWTLEVISSRMVPLKWTRRDDMHCFDELDPLWKPLLANARMVFIAYLVFQAKNLSKCVRFLAQALEISHISRVFFPAFNKGTENKYYVLYLDIRR